MDLSTPHSGKGKRRSQPPRARRDSDPARNRRTGRQSRIRVGARPSAADGVRCGRHRCPLDQAPPDGLRVPVNVHRGVGREVDGGQVGVKPAPRSPVIICTQLELGEHGAPSGTRTPNPLIKRHFHTVCACLATSLTCCDVFAPVYQCAPKSVVVGVSRRCQTPFSRCWSSAEVRRDLLWSPVCGRLSPSVTDALWLSGSRSARSPDCILQCASGNVAHQGLGGAPVGLLRITVRWAYAAAAQSGVGSASSRGLIGAVRRADVHAVSQLADASGSGDEDNLLIRSPGGHQSACVTASLTCGDVSIAVGHRVSKSAPIAVNHCYQVGFRIPGFETTSGVVAETRTAPSSMPPDDVDVRG